MKQFTLQENELLEYAHINFMGSVCGGVGRKLYDRANEIELKYPESFPWETKCRSIPKEVHEAHRDELAAYYQSLPSEFDGVEPGILSMVKHMEEVSAKERERTKNFTPKQLCDEMVQSLKEKERLDTEELAKKKEVWDTHYKPFSLLYRDGY